jgi:uncharacterized protein (DUF697 family)
MTMTQPMTCKEKAREYVHVTAIGGGALAAVPIPGMGTVGLTALEGTLVYWVGRVYGEKLDKAEVAMIIGSLGIASLGIKMGVLELLNFVPIAGWLAKVPIAGGIIEGIGALAINHFEDKYPGRLYEADAEVERQARRKRRG